MKRFPVDCALIWVELTREVLLQCLKAKGDIREVEGLLDVPCKLWQERASALRWGLGWSTDWFAESRGLDVVRESIAGQDLAQSRHGLGRLQ